MELFCGDAVTCESPCESQFFGEWQKSLEEEFSATWQQVSATLKTTHGVQDPGNKIMSDSSM